MMDNSAYRILHLGPASGTSAHRAAALQRLGHQVTVLDIASMLPKGANIWLNRFGGVGLDTLSAWHLRNRLHGQTFDLALVDSGYLFGPRSLKAIRGASAIVGNYNPDNPYLDPPTEGKRWTIFRRAMRLYDLCVSIRRPGAEDNLCRHGIKNFILVNFAADETFHRPPDADQHLGIPASEVVFVGTWMPGRGAFMAGLLAAGIDLSIYGPRWDKAPEFEAIRAAWKGRYLADMQYRDAIAAAKVALVVLNPENHDLHTTRSLEIPAIGTAMCAPRTADHEAFYVDGTEVMLYESLADCIEKCQTLLANDVMRREIAEAGRRRTFVNKSYNETLMSEIIRALAATGRTN